MKNKDLKKRIIDISYKHHLSHIGSCLTAVDIIDEIYSIKKPDERFVLSSGHAGLALYVVLEKYKGIDAEKNFLLNGVHPDRLEGIGIDCSTGSLGCGLPIACGMALADRNKNIYVLCSDGEFNEGDCYEILEVAHQLSLSNLKIYINCNGFGAYMPIDRNHLIDRCRAYSNVNITFRQTNLNEWTEWLQTQEAHYAVMDEKRYKEVLKILQ